MILKKDMLTKALKKGRLEAVGLLDRLSRAGGIPDPHYDYEAGGSTKKRSHFYKVRFRVPEFLRADFDFRYFSSRNVAGAGRCTTKKFAKSLAALEAVHRLEEGMDLERGGLQKRLEDYEQKRQERKEEIEMTPVEEEIVGVSWENIPVDPAFAETMPANRRGRIEFHPRLVKNADAFIAAKGLTLCAMLGLPEIAVHANQTDYSSEVQRFANIKPHSGGSHVISGPKDEDAKHIDNRQAEIRTLEKIYNSRFRKWEWEEETPTSFGMAKCFAGLPRHQFKELNELLQQVEETETEDEESGKVDKRLPKHNNNNRHQHRQSGKHEQVQGDALKLGSRLRSFREHQQQCSLPVDSIEDDIPHDVDVTIVRGGTGSGKTTRYPLMLSLFSPTGPSTKVLVAQPRRLACQTAARRVAFEQDVELGSADCSIGYSIRFESFHSTAQHRTVDFQTPGIILRRAMDDPLLRDVTHLVLDEIHERNADMDLLVALAKEAQRQRAADDSLPPLRVVLMSATLDSSKWESYFTTISDNGQEGRTGTSVAVVDVPDARRFPIDIVHLGENNFPTKNLQSVQRLLKRRGGHDGAEFDDTYDDRLCEATAQLATWLAGKDGVDGSVLCFLPGMDEIRAVDRLIREYSRENKSPVVRYLHSSLSSKEQAKAFVPGPKIILSTNIAETSVTIPDVKVVIDTGRERQFSLLDDSSKAFENMSVVGSQLATVNISQAAAKQRAGRSGRVSAGTCYRLYKRQDFEQNFVKFTKPEMLRMDLSQLILHSLSMYHPHSGRPLHLLLGTPDPPAATRVEQTIRSLALQGLVDETGDDVGLTPLGNAVSSLPASPRVGRMIFMGLVLRSIDPALQIAALLAVPKVFMTNSTENGDSPNHSSDIVRLLEAYQNYLAENRNRRRPKSPLDKQFSQAYRVEQQLKQAVKSILKQQSKRIDSKGVEVDWSDWNANSERVAALVALVCSATPHIAHLVDGTMNFATRDIAGTARIHPSSINAGPKRRSHWYLYNELRTTSAPYLHLTTAASPLELALFAEATFLGSDDDDHSEDEAVNYLFLGPESDDWLFVADQWVPVALSAPGQRSSFAKLRQLFHRMLQQVAQDPNSVLSNPQYSRILLFVLSAIEQQRLEK